MGLASAGETIVQTALLTGRYLSLHVGDPGDDGANEVAGGAYARQPVSFDLTGSNPNVASNNAIVQFPTATALWGTITHFGVWTAASGGSYLIGGPVSIPKTIDEDDIARWLVGSLLIEVD